MALIFDLGLNRPPPTLNKSLFETALRETTHPAFPRPGASIKTTRTLEDRRVVLGMFFISSAFVFSSALVVNYSKVCQGLEILSQQN